MTRIVIERSLIYLTFKPFSVFWHIIGRSVGWQRVCSKRVFGKGFWRLVNNTKNLLNGKYFLFSFVFFSFIFISFGDKFTSVFPTNLALGQCKKKEYVLKTIYDNDERVKHAAAVAAAIAQTLVTPFHDGKDNEDE